ncbi:hypothetical protein [Baekduia sp. Peel2402]|uniref:hypothetical protein n=1 Tax=Baekduia sp. Peel2402 TaxID=3458296 RepID=UPI00403E67F8
MYSLEQAVVVTENFRQDDEEWSATWLSILDERPYVAVDCGVGLDDPVPVWHYGSDWGTPTRPVFASIGDMVSFWIELIEDGSMNWEDPMWRRRADLPEELGERLSGVPQD